MAKTVYSSFCISLQSFEKFTLACVLSEVLYLFYLWKGTVTEFKHPNDFHVQLHSSEVLEYMNQLSASLKEIYTNTVHEDGYIPVKGEVCVAKYTVDQVSPN